MTPIILLSDFGLQDHYVGVLHAVLSQRAPGHERVDLSHGIAPSDIWAASFTLRASWPYLPNPCVVLAVVDPGVGSPRRAVAVRCGGRWLVAPDNGLAAAPQALDEAVEIDPATLHSGEVSATFHGRDVFAPAAARLACGDHNIGTSCLIESLWPCPLPEPLITDDGATGTIIHVDRFGNLVTNLPALLAGSKKQLVYGNGQSARFVDYFGQGTGDEVFAIAGSSGLIELAVNQKSAAEQTGLDRGAAVQVRTSV